MVLTPSVESAKEIAPFSYRWPRVIEDFHRGWEIDILVAGAPHLVRHGLARRDVFGRERVHSVTFVDDQPQVEAAEADDYQATANLIGSIRSADNKFASDPQGLPPGYERFEVVVHRDAITGAFARRSFAVCLREDDLESWSVHAWWQCELRHQRQVGRGS